MKTIDELLAESDKLYKAQNYEAIFKLLDNKILTPLGGDPDVAKLYIYRGASHYNQDNLDQAIEDYSKAIDIQPDHALAYSNRGDVWKYRNEFEKAISDYGKAIEINPANIQAYQNRGSSYISTKEYDKAVDDYTVVVAADPQNADAWCDLGVSWYFRNELDKAIESYTKAIEVNPDFILAINNRAQAWRDKKEYDKAITDYSTVIEKEPHNIKGYKNRGGVFLDAKDYDRAIEDYNKILGIDSGNSDAWCDMGVAYYFKNDRTKAIECYSKAIELNPSFILALNNRANALVDNKEYEKAITDYNAILEIDPQNIETYYSRAFTWYEMKNVDEAFKDYSRILEINDSDSGAYNGRGVMYYEKKQFPEALEDFNKSITLNDSYALAYNNRHQLHYDLGNYFDSVNDYTRSLQLDAENTDNYKCVAFLYAVHAMLRDETPLDVRKKIIMVSGKIMAEIIINIRQVALDHDGAQIAHYTKLNVADLLIYDAAGNTAPGRKLRYYNAVYMNDPQEGMVLLEYWKNLIAQNPDAEVARKNYEAIKKAFDTGRGEENDVYLGSFLPHDHKDDLVMWRTYGKDEKNNEAAGCSIVITTDFFDKGEGSDAVQRLSFTDTQSTLAPATDAVSNTGIAAKGDGTDVMQSLTLSNNKTITATGKSASTKQPLYRVIYYDKRKGRFITNNDVKADEDSEKVKKYLELMMNEILTLIALKEPEALQAKNRPAINVAIDKAIYFVISELRYFFKSADYSFENEYRVIAIAKPTDDIVKIDESSSPRRLYIESNKYIQAASENKSYIREVILGPKVANPERWIYLDALMRKKGFSDFQLRRSETQYQ